MSDVRRGWCEQDRRDFSPAAVSQLKMDVQELCYLLDRGYPIKPANVFVSNHHLLSERQRLALMRICASQKDLQERRNRQLPCLPEGAVAEIDGFNQIILLETALSGSLVFCGLDGCWRDLAGMRGTYRPIAATEQAVQMILAQLRQLQAGRAVFWLDAPVANSGRLKQIILQTASRQPLPVEVQVVTNPDHELIQKETVISGDSVILERCISWFNLSALLIPSISNGWAVDFRPEQATGGIINLKK